MRGVAAILLFLVLSPQARAGDGDAPPLAPPRANEDFDALELNRVNCQLEKARIANNPSGTRCREYFDTARHEAAVTEMNTAFCTNPVRFCSEIRKRSHAGGDQDFVGPRCEAGALPSWTLVDEAMPNLSPRSPYFARMVRERWGCASGAEAFAGASAAGLTLRFSCDASKMPFACDGSKPRETEFARLSMVATGAKFQLQGDRCTISMPAQALPDGMPAPGNGESVTAYASRLGSDQAARFRDERRRLGEASNTVFNSVSELVGQGTMRFNEGARLAFNSSRVSLARNSFVSAKDSIVRYLRGSGAPDSIIELVNSTQLMGFGAFLKAPADRSPEEARDVRTVEAKCAYDAPKGHSHSFGKCNGFNRPAGNGLNKVYICPSLLLTADLSNPRMLVSFLAHELGHSIDPCALGNRALALSDPSRLHASCRTARLRTHNEHVGTSLNRLPATGAGKAAELAFIRKVNGPGGFMSCTYAGGINPAGTLRDAEAGVANTEPASCVGASERCRANESLESGMLAHCRHEPTPLSQSHAPGCGPVNQARDAFNSELSQRKNDLGSKTPATATAARESLRRSQAGESFADFISSQALVGALDDPRTDPRLSSLTTPTDRRSEILTGLSIWCDPEYSPKFVDDNSRKLDEHPVGTKRIETFASSESIRRTLGCEPLDPAATEAGRANFPRSSCASRLGP